MRRLWMLGPVLLLAGCSGEVDTSRDAEYEAKDACHHFIEQHLQAPSTAEYSDESVTGAGSNWTCAGTVDSENAFGAAIRNTYVIKVEKRDDGLWHEVTVTGLDN